MVSRTYGTFSALPTSDFGLPTPVFGLPTSVFGLPTSPKSSLIPQVINKKNCKTFQEKVLQFKYFHHIWCANKYCGEDTTK